MVEIGIIVGSTRPGRKAPAVSEWVLEHAQKRQDARFRLLDIADFGLPLLDAETPPSMVKGGNYETEHAKKWAAAVAPLDGFVVVTPEYNHSTSGALKNALDHIYAEWNDKAVGFVSYGSAGGARAVEQLRLVFAELQAATVRAQCMFYLDRDFEKYTTFKPEDGREKMLGQMLDQLVAWSGALRGLREAKRE